MGVLPFWAKFNLPGSQVVVDLDLVAPIALKAIGASVLDTYTLGIISPNIGEYIHRILNNNVGYPLNFETKKKIPVGRTSITFANEYLMYYDVIEKALKEAPVPVQERKP